MCILCRRAASLAGAGSLVAPAGPENKRAPFSRVVFRAPPGGTNNLSITLINYILRKTCSQGLLLLLFVAKGGRRCRVGKRALLPLSRNPPEGGRRPH
eukprot:8810476-Pyramimonas_sp.AAC.1